ncbi:MAG TPA: UbiX family flavin prenyltransferase [Parvularculaceae bacterium]|nr:UbiX family flavin prenyltransferase [Parvularculaceae bacterium]HNS87930.1 UbiX family flavin prenyltransferase [Parvularculaceae bacterium]
MNSPRRIIVAVTGASGVIYGKRCLEALKAAGVETHLVVSRAAEMTLKYELDLKASDLESLASKRYSATDLGAPVSSGSFRTDGMIIAPCSVKTMSEIATGVTSTLVSRAADVILKERRRLVLMVRETPFHLGHLRTMTALTEMGAVIAPPLPSFYIEPKTVDELVDQSVGRVLDLFDIDSPLVRRWGIDLEKGSRS